MFFMKKINQTTVAAINMFKSSLQYFHDNLEPVPLVSSLSRIELDGRYRCWIKECQNQ